MIGSVVFWFSKQNSRVKLSKPPSVPHVVPFFSLKCVFFSLKLTQTDQTEHGKNQDTSDQTEQKSVTWGWDGDAEDLSGLHWVWAFHDGVSGRHRCATAEPFPTPQDWRKHGRSEATRCATGESGMNSDAEISDASVFWRSIGDLWDLELAEAKKISGRLPTRLWQRISDRCWLHLGEWFHKFR